MKRLRSPPPSLEPILSKDVFASISNDLSLYVLSFAYKDYACLVRVCRRFHTLLSHRELYETWSPTHVLQDLDFFHGLGPGDPPWAWLGVFGT
jgi:hypothetical protein